MRMKPNVKTTLISCPFILSKSSDMISGMMHSRITSRMMQTGARMEAFLYCLTDFKRVFNIYYSKK